MDVTELDEIRTLWESKYPSVTATLWSNEDGTKFHGMMRTSEQNLDIWADTIGELISLGEEFLRKVL